VSPAPPPEQPGQALAGPPLLRVLSPDATPEEVAALVAVLSSLGGRAPLPRRPRPAWSSPARAVRRPLPQGAGAWRSTGLAH